MDVWQLTTYGMAAAATALGFGCAIHALLNKTRTSTSAMAWILVCIALPLIGGLLYLTIGQDRIARKRQFRIRLARARFRQERRSGVDLLPADQEGLDRETALQRVLARVAGTTVTAGNEIRCYVGGERAYPAMLAAIDGARTTLDVQFYIFDDDRVGKEFRDALVRKAAEGIEVRFLYDAVGCAATYRGFWESLKEGGVRVAPFMPLRFFKRRWQINLRNHRKLLVVDREVAFTGSMNVSARHVLNEQGSSRDLMCRLRGPAVLGLLEVFALDWHYATKESLATELETVSPEERGSLQLQVLESGPDQNRNPYHEALMSGLHHAERSVDLVTPYFVPDPSVSDALMLASRRGVEVRLIVPRRPDHLIVALAMEDHLHQIMDAGVAVLRRPGPMLHMKLAVFDREVTLVGSSNLDARSFFLNFETDLLVHGPAFAAEILDVIDAESLSSHPLKPWSLDDRSLLRRFTIRLASLFSPIL